MRSSTAPLSPVPTRRSRVPALAFATVLALCGAPGPEAAASDVSYRGGTYDVQGSARILSSGVKRPISGKVIIEHTGDVLQSTFHMRSVARTPVGLRRVEFIGRGEGKLVGNDVSGTADVRILLAHVEGEAATEPPQELLRLENAYTGHFEEDGVFRVSLDYEPVEGGPPEPSTTELIGRRVASSLLLEDQEDAYPQRFLSLAETEAGRIRQLTQRGVREFALSAVGAPGARWEDVAETSREFDAVVSRVESLIARAPIDDRKRFTEQLDVIRERWIPVRAVLARPPVSAGPVRAGNLVDKSALLTLDQRASEALEAADQLIRQMSETCDPTLSLRCHISIDMAGRQRMLTERILKNLVILGNDIAPAEERKGQIQKDRLEFDENLATIREGIEFLRGAVSDDPEVVTLDVESIAQRWNGFQTHVDEILRGRRTRGGGIPTSALVAQAGLATALDKFTTQVALANF